MIDRDRLTADTKRLAKRIRHIAETLRVTENRDADYPEADPTEADELAAIADALERIPTDAETPDPADDTEDLTVWRTMSQSPTTK